MPFKSQAQRRYMYSQHPEMAEKWEKETPKGKKLPTRLKTAGRTFTDGGKTYDVEKLWESKGKERRTSPHQLLKSTGRTWGHGEGKYGWRDVLANPEKYPSDMGRIRKANLTYPVLLHNGIVVDGIHRLVKAKQTGKTISSVTLSKADMDQALVNKKLFSRSKTAANHAAEADKVRSTISGFFEAQGLPSSTPYVLTAGSSLFFHGFRPERGGDVDLYIPGMKKPHATAVINGVEVDAYNSWMGFGPALLKGRTQKHGVWISDLKTEADYKSTLNKPKHQRDAQMIRSFLAAPTKRDSAPAGNNTVKAHTRTLSNGKVVQVRGHARGGIKTAATRKVHAKVRSALHSFFEENNLPQDTPHAIMAGGSMHLQGMRRKFNDVDVFVPGLKKKKVDSVHNGLEVDAGNTVFDKAFSKQILKNRVHKDGLQLMSLPDVLEFKRRLNRPKDQRDIRVLERHLQVKTATIMFSAFGDELEKISYAKEFAGGLDPFGFWTGRYGQEAQRRGDSEAIHTGRRLIGTAGGIVGGGILLPSAISGVMGAVGGAKKGLGGAARGFVTGARKPVGNLLRARTATKFLGRAQSLGTAVPTSKELAALRGLSQQATVGSLMPHLAGKGARGQAAKAKKYSRLLQAKKRVGRISGDVAAAGHEGLRGPIQEALTGVGMGGAVGGVGAYAQYGKGREAERGFQKRLQEGERASAS
jgi:hypothetical protein